MTASLPEQFYVTGTDTDVGKTVVSAVLAKVLGRTYYKPVQSGLPADTDTVTSLVGVPTQPESVRLKRPASPHAAAQDEGRVVTLQDIQHPNGPTVVEGAGGWMVPYAMNDGAVLWQSDVVRHLALSVVVVARSGLGTLNHTLLTLRAIRDDGVRPLGLVLVGPEHPDNERDLPILGGVPVWARLDRVQLPEQVDSLLTSMASQLASRGTR